MIADIIVGVVVLMSALVSFLRGFIREVLTIAGVVGGIIAAVFGGPHIVPLVRDWLGVNDADTPEKLFDLVPMTVVADVLTYGSIFVIVVVALSFVSHVIAGAAKAMGLGPVDRTLGVVFGIVRAVVLLALLYMPFHLLMDEDSKTSFFEGSRTYIYIEKTADWLASFLPESDDVEAEVDEAKTKAGDRIRKKLEEQDLLRGKEVIPAPDMPRKTQEGYGDAQRENMDKLFEEPGYNE